ncbi:MAG: SDR family oxidoreductase [Gemmatimonadetes bacterium]|jgi:NAD(P)-dependent dehydrogenase (short-subunit alcohol dehydrogenase family)|nr:SDR family oxidoreductase [Gemmatimonadota bacterium]
MSVVLITGCSSGIGLESAVAFARRSDTTIATMRDTARGDRLRERCDREGSRVEILPLDVTEERSVEETVGSVLETHGAIDVLVNNAGVGTSGPVEHQSLEIARRVMDTNLWGPVRLIQAVLPSMRARRSGVIVNVSSLASLLPATMFHSVYAASKRALNAVSEALFLEVLPFGIRVVSVEPGFFKTEILAKGLRGGEPPSDVYAADQEWIGSFYEKSIGEGPSPEHVADAIVRAATDSSTRLHTPVGEDAAMYLELLDQVDGYEGWLEAVGPMTESLVGLRPTHPRE